MVLQRYLDFINEKVGFNSFSKSEDTYIISKGKDIYFLSGDDKDNQDIYIKLVQSLGLDIDVDEFNLSGDLININLSDIINTITKSPGRPDIMLLKWNTDELDSVIQINYLEYNPDPFVSKELKDIKIFID